MKNNIFEIIDVEGLSSLISQEDVVIGLCINIVLIFEKK